MKTNRLFYLIELAAVAALRLDAPVAAGDVLIEDVCGTGVAVVATKSVC